MIPLAGLPWRLIAKGVGILLVVAGLWWAQARIRVSYQAEHERDAAIEQHAAYREAVQASAIRAVARMEIDAAADAETADRIEKLESEAAGLRLAASRIPSTVEKPDAKGVPRLAINGPWWLCVSSHLTRDAADVSACEAGSGVAGVPDAVRR